MRNADYLRALRAKARANGLCPNCRAREPEEQQSQCEYCNHASRLQKRSIRVKFFVCCQSAERHRADCRW